MTAAKAEVLTSDSLALAEELTRRGTRLWRRPFDALEVELRRSGESLWLVVQGERGGLALRVIRAPAGPLGDVTIEEGEALVCRADTVSGRFEATVRVEPGAMPALRSTLVLTPAAPLAPPMLGRDLIAFGADGDPAQAKGEVKAAQRGLNTGLVFGRLDAPGFGDFLYFQNLTALDGYFQATGTRPDGAVGGAWPELGYLAPTERTVGNGEPVLAAGEPVTLSDALLVLRERTEPGEYGSAIAFLQMLGEAYERIEKPPRRWHDWAARAERTLKDLADSPKATIRHYGHRYVHPYIASEYPDSMVQAVTVASLADYAAWAKRPLPLQAELAAGMPRFYDAKLKTLRRYLPNVGDDKNADAVDSWYLYHPMQKLGRLALAGDGQARELFLGSIDYAVRAGRHFNYIWPIQYDVTDFSVITKARDEQGLGQTDVGGLYAYVMLQAYELTGEDRFIDEARAALDATCDMRFDLNYQANLTAWGATACARLAVITGDADYMKRAHTFLASFFHNAALWESNIANARHYTNFLGVSALHDGPYMAIYECFDSFAAFEELLLSASIALDPSARRLVIDYCCYALSRAWYYYPDALPPEAVAKDGIRNGHIDRKLSFPVEDLYIDGQPAGQVGQEIYGAGAAFVFTSRTVHAIEGAPFRLTCDHFIGTSDRLGEGVVRLAAVGTPGTEARLSVVRLPRRRLPELRVVALGKTLDPTATEAGRIEYAVPAGEPVDVIWTVRPKRARRGR
ncbi:hypothetical protein [Sphingomonas sp. DT-204]|uniref:hypothetical protein n=1 Tax=Sphingomonas sp. DT-204 TaxID=3396166 RepID=UPI003F1CFCFD